MVKNWWFEWSKTFLVSNLTQRRISDRWRRISIFIWKVSFQKLIMSLRFEQTINLYCIDYTQLINTFSVLQMRYGIFKKKLLEQQAHSKVLNIGIPFCSLSIQIFVTNFHWKKIIKKSIWSLSYFPEGCKSVITVTLITWHYRKHESEYITYMLFKGPCYFIRKRPRDSNIW